MNAGASRSGPRRDLATFPAVNRQGQAQRHRIGGIVLVAVLLVLSGGCAQLGHLVAPKPTPQVVALADQAFLTDEGRRIFYDTHPRVLDGPNFAGKCDHDGAVIGCFVGPPGSIFIFEPADPRLAAEMVTTAAHELLHAAYATQSDEEHDTLRPLLEAELARLPADHPVRTEIAGSVGDHPEQRTTELFAYLGSQIAGDGGFAPTLETVYARYISDRQALVAVSATLAASLQTALDEYTAAADQLVADEGAHAQAKADFEGEVAAVGQFRADYNAAVASYNAHTPEERGSMEMSWGLPDGTQIPMQAESATLAQALVYIKAFDAGRADREAGLAAKAAELTARRATLGAQLADLNALDAGQAPDS